jgi:hypothetical protein
MEPSLTVGANTPDASNSKIQTLPDIQPWDVTLRLPGIGRRIQQTDNKTQRGRCHNDHRPHFEFGVRGLIAR